MGKEKGTETPFNPWTAKFRRLRVKFNWDKLTEEEKIAKCVLEIYRYNPVWESYSNEARQEFTAEWIKWYKNRPDEIAERVKEATKKMSIPAYIRQARWESVQGINKDAFIKQISTRRG